LNYNWHIPIRFRTPACQIKVIFSNFAQNWLPWLARSLEESEKEVQIDHLRTNTYHLVKKIVKIGPMDPKIIDIRETFKKEITESKKVRSASLPSGH